MLVEDIMTRELWWVDMDATMEQVKHLFDAHSFHHLVVMDQGRVAGVLSDRDVLRTVSPFVGKLAERPVDVWSMQRRAHQVMSRGVVTISPKAKMSLAARLMFDRRISCLPVIEETGQCIGIVTMRDVLRWLVEHSELVDKAA